jgi:MFS family permease
MSRLGVASRLGIPQRTLALIAANSLAAAVQGQFQFVLPWMLLARGHSPQEAALASAFVYVPLLVFAVPAGATSDNADPRRLMRIVTVGTLAACALYPLAVLAGRDWFALVFVAAVVVGSLRNFSEGALFRGMGDTTRDDSLLRAHAVRTTVNQAAVFGSPFVGLLLYRFGGVTAVFIGICTLLVAAVMILGLVPELDRESESVAVMRAKVADGIASLRGNGRLRTIGWVNLTWNVFAGAAIGIMPAVLREHVGMDELHASATFIAGAVAVVALTLPLVRASQHRVGAISTFIIAITIQGAAVLLFAGPQVAIIAPVLYCLFLLSNSAAAASLNGARATEVEHDHQGLLNMALLTVGMVGFIAGVVLAAGLLGSLGFGALLVLIGVGMAATAVGFRRPLVAA